MKKTELATEYFNQGFNCAQSVLASFKEEVSLEEKDLLKIASGFGAGMGRLQQTCGAVAGACMVLGLIYGKDKSDDTEAGERTYALVQEFHSRFKELHNTTLCNELLGCSLTEEEGRAHFNEQNLLQTICFPCVRDAVLILHKLMN